PSLLRPLMAWLPAVATSAEAAVLAGDREMGARLYDALLPYAGQVVSTGDAVASVMGAASRYLGRLAALLERWDEAAAHFETAVAFDKKMGAPAFATCSLVLLAELLVARGGDHARARRLASEARGLARELGMKPWEQRATAILDATADLDQPLSRREQEVATLVAEGL